MGARSSTGFWGFETTRIDVEKFAKAIAATEWYGRLHQKWEWTSLMITIPKDRLPNIPMFLANIISEAHARSTIKIHEMTFDIAEVYGLVGPAERYLIPSMVFEVGALEQVGPNRGELTEFRISQPFMDQLKEWGVLVGESSTPAPGSR